MNITKKSGKPQPISYRGRTGMAEVTDKRDLTEPGVETEIKKEAAGLR